MDVTPKLSDLQLRDVVKNFLVGGRDTTAVTLAFCTYELAHHPEVQAKVRAEVENLPMDDPIAFYKAMGGLRYIDAVVKETIRLHTPVPVDSKVAICEDVLPGGHFVGKDYVMLYCPWVMARDTALWGQDAAEWRPERWLEQKTEPSLFVWSSFQAGPRTCLGKDLAILEAKAIIALLYNAGVNLDPWPRPNPGSINNPCLVLHLADSWATMRVTFSDNR